MSFRIIREDITRVKTDAIVNSANPLPIYASGLDYAIYTAAGAAEMLAARRQIGELARGEAAATPAFQLDAKYVIHTVGPAWHGGDHGEFETLRLCYENSLRLAESLKCRSIAFPLIATGVYGFPKDRALETAMAVISPFVMSHNINVILVVFDRRSFQLSGRLVDHVREYVDANYVQMVSTREYQFQRDRSTRRFESPHRAKRNAEAMLDMCMPSMKADLPDMSEELSCMKADLPDMKADLPDMSVELSCMSADLPDMNADLPCMESFALPREKRTAKEKRPAISDRGKVRIEDMLAAPGKTFQEKLFEIIDERGLTGPQVYKNYISKQVFSKIQQDKYYHPNKYTAIALCLSLHLDVTETQDLLGRAGWSLSPANRMDLIVKGCILNREYNIVNINIILFDFECEELAKIK